MSSDDDENDPYFDKYVSTAPLHLIRKVTYNIKPEEVKQLLESGYEIKRGRFSKKEDKRIRKNWRKFVKLFPKHSNPLETFGIFHKPKSYDIRRNREELYYSSSREGFYRKCRDQRVRSLKKIHFILRLARKLNDRLICDIYRRAKKVIAYNAYEHTKRKELPEEVFESIISDLYEEKKPIGLVGAELNVSPCLVADTARNPIRTRFHKWKKEDDLMLEMAIERQFNNRDPKTIPTYLIDFEHASKEMRSCGYHLSPNQLYRRWRLLNPKMVGRKKIDQHQKSQEEPEKIVDDGKHKDNKTDTIVLEYCSDSGTESTQIY